MTARRRHTPPDAPRPAPVPSSDAERLKRLYLRPLAPDGLERLAAEVGWDAPPADAGLDALDYLATDPAVTHSDYEKTSIVRCDVPCGPCYKRTCPTDHKCMKLITPEMVLAAAEDLLRRFGPHEPES